MKYIKLKTMFIIALLAMYDSVRGQNFDHAIGGRFGTDFMLTYKEFFMYYPKPQLAYEIMGGLQFDERVLGKRSSVIQTNGFVLQGMCYSYVFGIRYRFFGICRTWTFFRDLYSTG